MLLFVLLACGTFGNGFGGRLEPGLVAGLPPCDRGKLPVADLGGKSGGFTIGLSQSGIYRTGIGGSYKSGAR